MSDSSFEVWPGVPYPLGATSDGQGVNFAVHAPAATKVWVCLFDGQAPQRELRRLELRDTTNHVFHGYVPGLVSGALYGLRAEGPWDPRGGHRFNPAKLLVDPYARAIAGKLDWKAPLVGHVLKDGVELPDPRDSAAGVPRCVVTHDDFDWSGDKRPEVLWRKAIVYELHVKGFTALLPGVPPELRGTYAGLAHPAALEHLTSLGITSVELLPVHESVTEGFLVERGLTTNYWGYNSLGFFAPDQRFSSSGNRGQQVNEFKTMVKALHQAGLEVILDVVYNHTCEGNHQGPTLCLRGLDNAGAYWLDGEGRYGDFTGCGNSVRASSPQMVKLICDSLRAWVTEYRVDGFRFDLATSLARTDGGDFDSAAPLLTALHQDPVLSRVKLIAEPWDVGHGGYRVGNFPVAFAEWNDRYRDTVRKFWRGDRGLAADLGYRLTGSSDFFKISGRRPAASVNFVTAHDGFTLRDLVSYARKHNEQNGEENRDGTPDNFSTNQGAEGDTTDPVVKAMRLRMQKNFLATLFLSVGTPMLLAGDELGRTQHGNNNAYCQDNELSYVNWDLDDAQKDLLDFTRRVIALRHKEPVLERRNFFLGSTVEDSRFRDLVWFLPSGKEMEGADWTNPEVRCLAMFLGGDVMTARNPKGQRITGDTLLVYFNASDVAQEVTLPPVAWGNGWDVVLETAAAPRELSLHAAELFRVPSHAVVVLRLKPVAVPG